MKMFPHKPCLGILVIPLLILLVSCGVSSTQISQTKVAFSSSTPTKLPTDNISLTPTVLATNSLNPSNIQYKCINTQKNNLQLPSNNGTLILLEKKDQIPQNLLFLDLSSGAEKILPAEDIGTFSVSPKGEYLAYDSWINKKDLLLKISDSRGNLLMTISEREDWYGFEWLDDKNLLINYPIENNPLILFSPFNRQQKILDAYLTKDSYVFSDTDLIYYWGFYARHKNVYDPHLTRILYPSYDGKKDIPIVVIRDIVSNRDLASFPANVGWGVSPKWSPDGEKIAIGLNTNTSAKTDNNNQYELFVIGRDGEILLSTNLTLLSKTVYISYLSWSPDGRYVAFRHTNDTDINENLELAVLDTLTGQITNYCTTSDIKDLSFATGDPSPIWSPDSDFLLIETIDPETQVENILIIDIDNGEANLIKTGLVPIGWMK